MATTNLGRVRFRPRGDYNPAADPLYSLLDLVSDGGGSFAYINDTPSNEPTSSTSHWQQIASIGGQDLVDAAVAARDAAEGYKDDAAAYAAQLAAGTASPAGTYADLAALISADPDHSKIYITLADGSWCYYNGAAFVAGGVYQAASVVNEISEINRNIYEYNYRNDFVWHSITANPATPVVYNGVSITPLGYGKYSLIGTATETTLVQFYIKSNKIPDYLSVGDEKTLSLITDISSTIDLRINTYAGSPLVPTLYTIIEKNVPTKVTLPDGIEGVSIYARIGSGITVSGTVELCIDNGNMSNVALENVLDDNGIINYENDLSIILQDQDFVVLTPNRTYTMSSPVEKDRLIIVGNDAIINYTGTEISNLITVTGKCRLSNITIDVDRGVRNTLFCAGDSVVLEGVNILNNGFDHDADRLDACLSVWAEYVSLDRCKFNGSTGCGIEFGINETTGKNAIISVSNVECNDNGFFGMVRYKVFDYVVSCVINNCKCNNNAVYSGMALHNMYNVKVSNSEANNNGEHGIVLQETLKCGVFGCKCEYNGASGIRMQAAYTEESYIGVYDTVISGNYLRENSNYGINVGSYTRHCIIDSNIIRNNLRPIQFVKDTFTYGTNPNSDNIIVSKNLMYSNVDTDYIVVSGAKLPTELILINNDSLGVVTNEYVFDHYLTPMKIYRPQVYKDEFTDTVLDGTYDPVTDVYQSDAGNSNKIISYELPYNQESYLTMTFRFVEQSGLGLCIYIESYNNDTKLEEFNAGRLGREGYIDESVNISATLDIMRLCKTETNRILLSVRGYGSPQVSTKISKFIAKYGKEMPLI